MRTVGASICLVLLALSGWLIQTSLLSKTQPLDSLAPASSLLAVSLEQASNIYRNGKYDEAAQAYSTGYRIASHRGKRALAAAFLWGIGNCHLKRHQYRHAIESFL